MLCTLESLLSDESSVTQQSPGYDLNFQAPFICIHDAHLHARAVRLTHGTADRLSTWPPVARTLTLVRDVVIKRTTNQQLRRHVNRVLFFYH